MNAWCVCVYVCDFACACTMGIFLCMFLHWERGEAVEAWECERGLDPHVCCRTLTAGNRRRSTVTSWILEISLATWENSALQFRLLLQSGSSRVTWTVFAGTGHAITINVVVFGFCVGWLPLLVGGFLVFRRSSKMSRDAASQLPSAPLVTSSICALTPFRMCVYFDWAFSVLSSVEVVFVG